MQSLEPGEPFGDLEGALGLLRTLSPAIHITSTERSAEVASTQVVIGEAYAASIERRTDTESGVTFVVHRDGVDISSSPHLHIAEHRLAEDVERYLVEHTDRYVVVHSGVVCLRDRAVLVPGRSESGKTTLVMELLQQGAGYYSDEYALLDSAGLVHAYPRRPSVRAEGARSEADLPAGVGTDLPPRPVAAVLVTEFDPSIDAPDLAELTPGEGVLELMKHAFAAQTAPERCLEAFAAVTESAVMWKGRRNEAADFARWLLEDSQLV